MAASFVHLHNHSEYSLLDGTSSLQGLVQTAVDYDMQAVALTDHGSLHGLVSFYRFAKQSKVKPILGCELYLAPRSRHDRQGSIDREPHHLVLLAENARGYANLVQLSSRGHMEGFYYKPRIDFSLLEQYNEGLIALSGCIAGELPQLILAQDSEAIHQSMKRYLDIFGSRNFFLEMQDHGLPQERQINRTLLQLSKAYNVGSVATNDCHYLRHEDAAMHDIMLCVQTQSRLNDEKRLRFPNDQYYFKSPEEMQRLFSFAPEAISNTLAIADRCHFDFTFGEFQLPEYPLPPGEISAEAMLRRLVEEGIVRRYGANAKEARERAANELVIICQMGFVGYFLIVWDFVNYAKQNGIEVGPGRGSATGSLVSYALNITEVDPLTYGLIFERFLNPERISMPDIDIDFCFERRNEVIDYVVAKYGSDHVAQIVTFGTLGTRSAVRDIARALEVPQHETDRLAKMIPWDYHQSVHNAIANIPQLQEEIRQKPLVKRVFDIAALVEGKPRNISMHAAGVVITPRPLTELLPVLRPKDDGLLTQYAMNELEALGFLKMDFLGLRTLTLLRNTERLAKSRDPGCPTVEEIPLDDKLTYELLSRGDTDGVFQLESAGMKRVLRSLKPSCIEDVIATNALYRPGPMEHIPDFIAAKEGKAKPNYLHAKLEPILESTYGVLVYQEQVIRIASDIAGFSLGQADLLRRAMGKRDAKLLQEQRQLFIDGAMNQGVSEEVANAIFELIRPFGAYGFNKSHSAAYGILAYQSAWFKTHYPIEYSASLLSSLYGSPEQISRYVQQMQKQHIVFLSPHLNESFKQFSVEQNSIRFGLMAIKNLGLTSIEAILEERSQNGAYRSLADLFHRVGNHLNKRSAEALIKSGALDSFGTRAWLLVMLPRILERSSLQAQFTARGQTSLLGDAPVEKIDETDIDYITQREQAGEFSLKDLQAMEEEITGYIFSVGKPSQTAQLASPRIKPVAIKAHAEEKLGEIIEGSTLHLTISKSSSLSLSELKQILVKYQGDIPVYLELVNLQRTQVVPREFWVSLDANLLKELQRHLGEKAVVIQ